MLKNEWWKISQIIIYHSLRRCPNSNQNNGVLNWPSDVGNDLLPCRLYDRVYFLTIITIWTRAFGKGNLSTFMFMKSNACTFTRLEHLNIQCNYSSSNDEEKNFFYFFFPLPSWFYFTLKWIWEEHCFLLQLFTQNQMQTFTKLTFVWHRDIKLGN